MVTQDEKSKDGMRERLGILLMEEENGEIAVQLFADPDKLAESFKQMKGNHTDPNRRATFIRLEYGAVTIEAHAKELPVNEGSKENAPDGYRLGEGPIYFDKEENETKPDNKSE